MQYLLCLHISYQVYCLYLESNTKLHIKFGMYMGFTVKYANVAKTGRVLKMKILDWHNVIFINGRRR